MVTQYQTSADLVGNAKEFERIKAANAEPWI
jgi:hypothetical protein